MKKLLLIFEILFLFLSINWKLTQSKDTFSKISENIFSNIKCVPYAYGDFNGDKRVDIFCVSDQGIFYILIYELIKRIYYE
jgi:hypothetical protein